MRETFIRKYTHESSSRVPSRLYHPAKIFFAGLFNHRLRQFVPSQDCIFKFCVFVFVMDWIRIGLPPPIFRFPICITFVLSLCIIYLLLKSLRDGTKEQSHFGTHFMRGTFIRKCTHESSSRVPSRLYHPA